jgi:hypothetical protein
MITQDILNAVSEAGFIAYLRDPKDTWLYFTTQDGKHIGYLQADRSGYVTISTVHVPCSAIGTGFRCDPIPSLSKENLQKAFAIAPLWANSQDRSRVRKWKDWQAYVKSSPFNKEYKRVFDSASES